MDYKDLSPVKQRYLSLSKYLGLQEMKPEEIVELPDFMVESFVKDLEDFMDKKMKSGGIVSINRMTQPIGFM